MEWLITSGIISLFFGLLLLFSKNALLFLGGFFNRPVVIIDDLVKNVRVPAGLVLTLTGLWIIYSAFCCIELWFLHLAGVLVLFFGLLYLFWPQWLEWSSSVADRLLFTTDVFVVGFRKGLGITLIVVAVYLFYSAYLI